MNVEKQKLLIFGLGFFGRELLKTLTTGWDVVAVDRKDTRVKQCREENPDVEIHHGAADSVLTWRELDLTDIKYIISAGRNTEVDLEVCRIARDVFKLEIPIIVLVYENVDEEPFEKFNVSIVNPMEQGVRVVLKRLEKNVSRAVNVGLGKGELIEVKIMAGSHLVDRKLKYLRPSHWHISALYRDGKLILPDGNSSLKIGDRVLLVGAPQVLESVAALLLKGLPQFPLQYGSTIVFPLHMDFMFNMDEAAYLHTFFKAKGITFVPFNKQPLLALEEKIKKDVSNFEMKPSIALFKEIFMQKLDTGFMVVPVAQKAGGSSGWGWLKHSRLRNCFKLARKPFLLSRLTFPYRGVIISLNGPDPAQAMETGIEMAKLLDIPFKVLYVALPKEMRGNEDEEHLLLRQDIVSDFEGIYKTTIQYDVPVGNPVRESLKYLEPLENHVLVINSEQGASLSFFKPNISYLIAKKTGLSTLVIPEAHSNE
ncbi:MAG: TrkA family potassium uptake protein [bacterium]|nr:TrkA family potassium uptake protein [bacterium]